MNDPPDKWVKPGSEPSGHVPTKKRKHMGNIALAFLAAGFGAGLAILGAGFGIGKLAASAMDGTARQPAAGGDIRTTMIIAAALIEGVTLFALVVCIILAVKS
jgi:F-type H+-transporting ATPase subunit c